MENGSEPGELGHDAAASAVVREFSFDEDAPDAGQQGLIDEPEAPAKGGSRWLAVLAVLAALWLVVALVDAVRSPDAPAPEVAAEATPTAVPTPTPAPVTIGEPSPEDASGAVAESDFVPQPAVTVLRTGAARQVVRREIDSRFSYLSEEGLVIIDASSGLANVVPIDERPVDPVAGMHVVLFGGGSYGIEPGLLSVARLDVQGPMVASDTRNGLLFKLSFPEVPTETERLPVQVLRRGGGVAGYTVPAGIYRYIQDQGYLVHGIGEVSGVYMTGSQGVEILTSGEQVLDVGSEAFLVSRCDEAATDDSCTVMIRERPSLGLEPLVIGEVETGDADQWSLSPTGTAAVMVRPDGSSTIFDAVGAWSTTTFDRNVEQPRWSVDGDALVWLDASDQSLLRIMIPETREWLAIDLRAEGLPLPLHLDLAAW